MIARTARRRSFSHRLISLTATLALGLSFAGGCKKGEDSELPFATPVASMMDYWVRDGGRWEADNYTFVKGSGMPKKFTQYAEYTLGGHGVLKSIGGVLENGATQHYWDTYYAWDPKANQLMIHQYGAGVFLQGKESDDGTGQLEIIYVGRSRDGTPVQIREMIRNVTEDQYHATTYLKESGQWVEKQFLRWRRK